MRRTISSGVPVLTAASSGSRLRDRRGRRRTSTRANTSATKVARGAGPEPHRLQVVVCAHVEADLEAREDCGLERVRRLADDAGMDGRALGAGDHVREVVEEGRIGKGALHHLSAEPTKRLDRRVDGRLDLPRRVHRRSIGRAHRPEAPRSAGRARPCSPGPGGRSRSRRGGRRPPITPRSNGRVTHGPGERSHVVKRPGERHPARPAHAPVGGLDPDDAAAGRGQADRAARIGAERAVNEPGGHGRARAARRAARAVAGPPGRLDVAVVDVVPEGSERQLREVQAAQRDRARRLQAGHGRRVLVGAGSTRGMAVPQDAGRPPQTKRSLCARGTPWRGPRTRPAFASASRIRAVRSAASVSTWMNARSRRSERFDPGEAGLGGFDRRNLAGPDPARPVPRGSPQPRAGDSAGAGLGSGAAPASRAAAKPAGSSARARSAAARSIAAARSASTPWRARSAWVVKGDLGLRGRRIIGDGAMLS